MTTYTNEEHIQMIKLFYQNKCSLVKTLRALRPIFGKRNGPSRSTIQRLVAKFETTGSVNNIPPPIRQRNARTAENIAAVLQSVQENPGLSIPRRSKELGLSQSSIWRILRRDLGLQPDDSQLDTTKIKQNNMDNTGEVLQPNSGESSGAISEPLSTSGCDSDSEMVEEPETNVEPPQKTGRKNQRRKNHRGGPKKQEKDLAANFPPQVDTSDDDDDVSPLPLEMVLEEAS